jgi:hypothetical protein
MPTLIMFFVIISNGIYINKVNNDKYNTDTEENVVFIDNAKSNYAYILLSPIIILIIGSIVISIVSPNPK